jgi:hypothetical protein
LSGEERASLEGWIRAATTEQRLARRAIDRFIDAYNETAAPFGWTKTTVTPQALAHKYSNL